MHLLRLCDQAGLAKHVAMMPAVTLLMLGQGPEYRLLQQQVLCDVVAADWDRERSDTDLVMIVVQFCNGQKMSVQSEVLTLCSATD